MGFNGVFKCLQDIFPQIDARILRAVAIEHPKDADLAAGIVLSEVIPLMSKRYPSATPPHDKGPGALTTVEEEQGNGLRHQQLVEETYAGPSAPCSVPAEDVKSANCSSGPHLNAILDESTLSNTCNSSDGTDKFRRINESDELDIFSNAEENLSREITDRITKDISNGLRHGATGNFDHELDCMDAESENLVTSSVCQEMRPEQTPLNKKISSTNNNGNGIANHLDKKWKDFYGPTADGYDAITCPMSHRSENCETALIEVESSEADADCHALRHMPNANERSLQSEYDCGPSIAAGKNLESGSSSSEQDYSVSKDNDVGAEISGNNVVSQSIQVCKIDLLEEIIDEAKTNKKILFSSMESLINLMREVELQEKAAELAKMEAALGGSEILVRVEELKKMLAHAKEANDMHAGEVYGEKAILATEMKELQSRLLSLSDERDKSLVILDEMHQTLEARLAAAEELSKAAEQEKLEKEESAKRVLAEQEAIMEKVVQESARLQQEAEENSKLREFLIDRGRVVDMLQGEISVICQDIRLLKEKFDANLPLSKSFTSSQTSCVLASSGSSHKSLASDVGSDHGDLTELLKGKPVSSIDELSSKSGYEEESGKAEHKALLDDGWDYI